ncbi:monocarboxylate transporter 13-like [Passer domesticus]|uniref:monocarboxylate transporter 13-like n=1 Tax=Passer domesticus TaxID=48849 RepID=UPI0030FF2F38
MAGEGRPEPLTSPGTPRDHGPPGPPKTRPGPPDSPPGPPRYLRCFPRLTSWGIPAPGVPRAGGGASGAGLEAAAPSLCPLGVPVSPRCPLTLAGRCPFPPGALPALSAAFLQVALVSGSARALGLCLPPLGGAFGAPARAAAWVGSCPLAALQLGGPLAAALSARFGPRGVAMAGGALAGAGLFLGAFATRLEHLYLSLGGLTGLGWSLAFTPALGAVSRWFPRRRALATGLAVSGAAVSGLALAPLLPLALDAYGWRGALLLLAAVSLHLVAAAALLRPPRAPPEPPEPPGGLRALPWLLRHGAFLRYAAAFALLDAGYFVPFVHGAGRALELGCDGDRAAAVVAAMAALDGGGRLAGGWLAARPGAALLRQLAAWAALAGLAALALPLGRSFGALAALAAAYGGCAGAVAPLQFAGVAEVVGAGRAALAIGAMQMFESVGSLLGPPLAGWLRDVTGDFTVSFLAAGAFLLASSLLILTLPRAPPEPPPSPPEPL